MEMAKVVRNWWSHSKTVVLIWSICIAIYFSLLRLALNNSSSLGYTSTIDSPVSNMEQRSRLYDKMERDLDENGPAFLKHGGTTQSLSLSDIFTLKDGSVKPVHKAANPPVRANVLYLSPEYSVPISESAKQVFHPYFGKAIWFQNSSLYHFSMFHASHHIVPVPATEDEIEAEATAVGAVAEGLCPLKIVLDRVVLTSTGVLLGCWQVISGPDPVTIRAKLRSALPRAPEKQLYDDAILHTSFARLLGHPKVSSTEPSKELHVSHELVARLNSIIRGAELFLNCGTWRNMTYWLSHWMEE
ncbi:hypothetical protein MANES_06G094000v8 [Manihot esculenta]|uniref:Uncharacterized protein n=1 Tax=Manihot esculenta TaxID=3983 RepID=A0A2C9VQS5_MANES|nr:hypothetical protein MANES_06G094000v8 [Manihot esculenta]